MKPYRVGLVVGKFAPLHLGHVALVKRALSDCHEVVIISYSNPELPEAPPALREQWLADCFPAATRFVVTNARLREWFSSDVSPPTVPANAESDDTHRDFVALLCKRLLPVGPDAIFSSESYGPGFAARLTECLRRVRPQTPEVEHIMVDQERRAVAISATDIRRDPWRYWAFLPAPVARTLVRRVALVGGESTGKSTLARVMAEELGTAYVPEYGRELWELRQGQLRFEDLLAIAREQIRREELALDTARAFLFCDTSPLTTLFYSQQLFNRADPEVVEAARRPYAEMVLCMPDFEFVQDGTRQDEGFRAAQNAWYEAELANRGIAYFRAHGPIPIRIETLRKALGVGS